MVAALHQRLSEIVRYDVSGGSLDLACLGPNWTFWPYPDHGTIAGEKPWVSTRCMMGNQICRSKVNRCRNFRLPSTLVQTAPLMTTFLITEPLSRLLNPMIYTALQRYWYEYSMVSKANCNLTWNIQYGTNVSWYLRGQNQIINKCAKIGCHQYILRSFNYLPFTFPTLSQLLHQFSSE